MLPSRGLVRSGQAAQLRLLVFPTANAQHSRGFGTALRRRGWVYRAPGAVSEAGLSMGLRRPGLVSASVASSLSSLAPAPAAAAAFSLYPWSYFRKKKDAAPTDAAAADVAGPSESLLSAEATPPATAAEIVQATTLPPTSEAAATVADAIPADSAAAISELLDGSALLEMPEQIGYLHALGLDFGWGPTSMCQWLLEHIHVYTGLPWWASIAATALLFRAAIFLPSLAAAEQSAKFQELRKNPKYATAMAEMQQLALRGGASQAKAMEQRLITKRMQQDAGIATWKMFIPMINVPFGYGMFRLLRSMAILPVPGLENSGVLWFTDLTVPDPYFILPISSAAIMYLIFRSNIKFMSPEQAQMMKMVQVVVTPLSLFVTVKMSAGLTFFFLTSSLLQMVQTWLWHQPWLRAWKGLPPLHKLIPNGAAAASAARTPAQRLSPGSTWQAPRTVNTTATVVSASEAAAATNGPPSTVDIVKKGWDKMMGTAKEKQGEAKTKQSVQKALEYEKKRALEEEERLFRRREAERQYRDMKKRMGKGEAKNATKYT